MNQYKINKNIDRETRFLGLTLDEFIPFICILTTGFFIKQLFFCVVIAIFMVLIIKRFKKGRRGHFLLNLVYWYTPKFFIKHYFLITPASEERFWLR